MFALFVYRIFFPFSIFLSLKISCRVIVFVSSFLHKNLSPREESNLYYEIRNLAFFPLNYEGKKAFVSPGGFGFAFRCLPTTQAGPRLTASLAGCSLGTAPAFKSSRAQSSLSALKIPVSPGGFEPPTSGSGGQRSSAELWGHFITPIFLPTYPPTCLDVLPRVKMITKSGAIVQDFVRRSGF